MLDEWDHLNYVTIYVHERYHFNFETTKFMDEWDHLKYAIGSFLWGLDLDMKQSWIIHVHWYVQIRLSHANWSTFQTMLNIYHHKNISYGQLFTY